MRARVSMASMVACIAWASASRAQPSEQDRALAQSLFDQGRELMDQNRLAEACPKLAESHRLDPGGGTLLNLAKCYERAGKVASAWAAYEEALALSRRDGRADRVEFCQRKLDELKPSISSLTLHVSERARVDGLQVVLGDRPLSSAAWGVRLPLDPGEYHVKVSAPGRKPWFHTVKVGERGDAQSVEVPALEVDETPPVTASPPVEPSTAPSPVPPMMVPAPPSKAEGSPVLGYMVGGVGLVALGVGGYFGLKAMSAWKDREEECDGNSCTVRGMEFDADTNRYANYSNVGFGAGLVGVGFGAYLLLSRRSTTEVRGTRSGPPIAGVVLDGNVAPRRVGASVSGVF